MDKSGIRLLMRVVNWTPSQMRIIQEPFCSDYDKDEKTPIRVSH